MSYYALGVVKDKDIPDKEKIKTLFLNLEEAFRRDEVQKEDIVQIMESYLPNFEHIETGKSLDSKM